MKNPILLLLAIFSIMPSFSTERDTTVIFNQKEILIKDSSEIVSVTVYENGNKYNKYYESRHIDGKKQTSWELSESVSFPFSDLISGKKKDKRKRFDPHWSGIGFGFCNAMGRGMKFLDSPRVFLSISPVLSKYFGISLPFLPPYIGIIGDLLPVSVSIGETTS